MPTRSGLRRTALLIAFALIGALLIAGPAEVERAAAATPPVDISGSMPRVSRGELTYDFLGKGYDQRLIAENGKLNLYDPPALGGTRQKSIDLDLVAPPFSIGVPGNVDREVYRDYTNESTLSCFGCLQQRAQTHSFNSIYLIVLDGWLYISGTKGGDVNTYVNLLYKAPIDLSCAAQACLPAGQVRQLPNAYADNIGGNIYTYAVGATALAGGFSGGNPYIAVGLTDYGVVLYDTNLNQVSNYTGMATPNPAQTPVISLAWDPAGSGKVAVGVMSYSNEGFVFDVAADGSISGAHNLPFGGFPQLYQLPLSVAFGRRADGSLLLMYGISGGVDGNFPAALFLVDPDVTDAVYPLASIPMPGDGVPTVQTMPRIDGTAGGDDFAVWSNAGFGSAIRYNQAANSLSFLPLLPSSATNPTQLGADAFRSWFPGYKTGRFTVQNTLAEPVTVTLQTRPQAGYGCWYAPSFADAPGFPTSAVTVAAGQSSPVFTMGGVTAGAQGRCGADDVTGDIRGYLVITPVNRPADVRIVDLQLRREDLTVDITDQAGGSTTVAATRSGKGAAFGTWTVTVGGPAAPTPLAAPTIAKARQITTNNRRGTTVYRIDLNGTRWSVPGATAASPQLQAVVPPLQVRASLDGVTWTPVGSFLPPGQLGLSGTTLTTSGGTFFWENPAGAPAYKQLQVLAGDLASASILLPGLQAPTPPSPAITELQLVVTKSPSNATANLVPNGLDQGQVNVQISAVSLLPTNDPAYDTVFYRDEDNNLITNLYQPGEFDQFVGVQPAAGAYPNTGVSTVKRGSVGSGQSFDYVSTNDLAERTVTGWVGVGPNASGSSAQLTVNDEALDIAPDPGGKAGAGFSLEGCTDFTSGPTCVVAPVGATRPALYQAGSDDTGPLLGAHLGYQAQNAVSDLPLEWQAQFGAQDLATSGLTLANRSALIKLSNPDGYLPGASVDLTVVSHGEPVTATVAVSD